MSDLAKGPVAGYLFQFEKALLLLAGLDNKSDFITIEEVDDIAAHKENGTVLITIQAKHSISRTGTTFEDTSYALWRTFQIWIEKFETGIFDTNTNFVCSTNKKIPNTSLLHKMKNDTIDHSLKDIENLLEKEKVKLKEVRKKDRKAGGTIKQIIKLIEFVITKKAVFTEIQKKLIIDSDDNIKENFYNKMHLNADSITDVYKEKVFEGFYGWIAQPCHH